MAKNPKPLDLFIVRHTNLLSRIIAIILMIWYFSGLILLDHLHPVIFLSLYVPIGLIAAYWANKW